jgi:hypothetical protein
MKRTSDILKKVFSSLDSWEVIFFKFS